MANDSYSKVSLPTQSVESQAKEGTAASLYASFESNRLTFLDRARDASKLTIPMLIPPSGHGEHTKYDTPFQSIGARGVNNLASKLLLALFPPNSPFFRLVIDPYILAKEAGEDADKLKTEMDKALSKIERIAMQEVETTAIRVGAYEAIRHLIVGGNVLVHTPDEGGLRVFRLDSFVVKRDPAGNVTHIVVKERVSPLTLPPEARALCYSSEEEHGTKEYVDVYTKICMEEDKSYEIYQEINGEIVPDSHGVYPEGKLPWMALRFNRVDGEDYGRGFVEEYIGDLRSLEALSRAVVEATAAASKVIFMVNPTGTTRIKTLADAPNGAYISGISTDVTSLQADKRADLSTVIAFTQDIQSRLSFAFLLNSAVQRNAERVTAEEIRFMAQELETTLGGAYSILSQEFQLPLVRRLLDRLNKQKRMPKLPKEIVKPMIVTGVEALGRGNDLMKLDQFLVGIQQALGPEAMRYVNPSEYLSRRAAALGIDSEGLIKTQDDLAAEQEAAQQQQQQQQMAALAPDMIKGMAQVASSTPETATAATSMLSRGMAQAQGQESNVPMNLEGFTPPSAQKKTK
jgi:hypothetical protein